MKFKLILGFALAFIAVNLAAEPTNQALLLSGLQVGKPIRQGYAYQVSIELNVHNQGQDSFPTVDFFFSYKPTGGKSYPCANQSIPSLPVFNGQTVRLDTLPPGGQRHLSGYALIPISWYRGNGTLHVRAEGCSQQASCTVGTASTELLLY